MMSIFDTLEYYLSNIDRKSDMRKVRTSSVKSSSILFSCLICTMYNIVHCVQIQHLMLNSYIPGINIPICPKRHCGNILSGKRVNELHSWIENHPRVIHTPNISGSLFIKINITFVNKQKYLLQISVRELHNDRILPIYQGNLFWCTNCRWKITYF